MREFQFGPRMSKGIKQIIIANVAIFAIDFILRNFLKSDFIIYYFALIPELIIHKFFIWQVFTYQFLHGGFFHIFFNMVILWMFGSELEYKLGYKRFLTFYFVTGTLTGITIFAFNYFMGVDLPTIGASGVIFSIMLVYAIYWGNRMVYVWMIIPIKVKYFVMILGAISFISMISPGQSNISHIGHFGGLISGYIYYRLYLKGITPSKKGGVFDDIKTWKKKKEWEKKSHERYDNMTMEEQVDEILAKISRSGIKSLSARERKILKDASDNLNNDKPH